MSLVNALLVRWAGGWHTVEDSASIATWGRYEGFLSLGAAQSIAEVERITAALFARRAQPVITTKMGIEPTGEGDVPFDDWNVSGEVTAPAEAGGTEALLVASLTLAEDADGELAFLPELNTAGELYEQRLERWLARMSNGALEGASASASPAEPAAPTPAAEFAAAAAGPSTPTIVVAAADSFNAGAADYLCDAGTDNDVKILEAWAELLAVSPGGMAGRLLMLPGTYTISDWLDFDAASQNGLSVWGYGARIIASGTYPDDDFNAMVALTNSIDAEIRGLRVECSDRAYNGIEMSNCERGLVEHCYVHEARRDGFDVGGFHPKVIACTAEDCGWNGFDLSGSYGKAIACTAVSCGATGQAALGGFDADGWGDGFDTNDGWEINACHAYLCVVNGFSGRATLTGCYAYQCGGYGFRNHSAATNCEAVFCGQSDGSAGGGYGRVTKAFVCIARLNEGKAGHHLTGSTCDAIGCSSELDARDGFLVDTSAAQLIGCKVEGAGTKTNNTYSAFHLMAAADGSLVEACKAYPDAGAANKAKAGVTIDSGCVSSKVVGNDLVPPTSAWQTAPIIDNGTTTKLVYPNHATYGDNFT